MEKSEFMGGENTAAHHNKKKRKANASITIKKMSLLGKNNKGKHGKGTAYRRESRVRGKDI